MKKANISKVKAEFSAFINMVKRGEEVVILDRDQPVALLTGIRERGDLHILESQTNTQELFRSLQTRSLGNKTDILRLLADERDERF